MKHSQRLVLDIQSLYILSNSVDRQTTLSKKATYQYMKSTASPHLFSFKKRLVQQESNTWKRSVTFMIDETIYLKSRLPELLQRPVADQALLSIESFQTRFLRQDLLIDILKHDIAEIEEIISRDIFNGDNVAIESLDSRMSHMRKLMTDAEQHFYTLKQEFNKYISETFSFYC